MPFLADHNDNEVRCQRCIGQEWPKRNSCACNALVLVHVPAHPCLSPRPRSVPERRSGSLTVPLPRHAREGSGMVSACKRRRYSYKGRSATTAFTASSACVEKTGRYVHGMFARAGCGALLHWLNCRVPRWSDMVFRPVVQALDALCKHKCVHVIVCIAPLDHCHFGNVILCKDRTQHLAGLCTTDGRYIIKHDSGWGEW